MRFVRGFGMVTRQDRKRADLFYQALTGVRTVPRAPAPRSFEAYEQEQAATPSPPPGPLPPAAQQPYLPAGGRNFTPQAGAFVCAPPTPFRVVAASFLPERTTDPGAAVEAALTAAGLNATQRAQVTRPGVSAIAAEFGAPALTELVARLRWSAGDIARWGQGTDSMLVPRLLIHIPGHFRELARRAPDAREAFVLECLGWLIMAQVRAAVANATTNSWWVPPSPAFVTAVPNPVPPLSASVSRLLLRYLLIDTAMTADQWNTRLLSWGNGLAGRQWQAEVNAPQPGRPFYASLATIPAHVSTATARAAFVAAFARHKDDVNVRHSPDAAGAAVTLEGLRNTIALRECANDSPRLPAGALGVLDLQGLELSFGFPRTRPRSITRLALMSQLHFVYTALFQAIRELGWNDLLYETEGGGCFRGIKHPADARVVIGGAQVTVNPFNQPDATTVTRINTLFTAAQRARLTAATESARTISEHGLGAAIDFNVSENEQNVAARRFGSMDPRIVAIFEAFHFRFGACFDPTDPMHFDYSQTPAALAPASAGTLGRVVTPRMLMPLRGTNVVA